MAVGGYVYTYPDKARRESLLDVMNMLEPTDTQLLSGLMQGPAANTLHEWTIDSLETVGDNAQPEGGAAPADASNDPSRPQNITQIFAKTAQITGSENADNLKRVAGKRLSRELVKKMKALKNDIEYALIRGSIASGVASNSTASARRLQGVSNWITSVTSNYSGTSLTETILNDGFQKVWANGAEVDSVYTTMTGKRRISGFTGPTGMQRTVNLNDRRLTNAIDVYSSDTAKLVKLFPHRHVQGGYTGDYVTTATPGFDVLALDEDFWGTAWYRRPFTQDLAITGDFVAKEIITEMTLEARNQAANVRYQLVF
jgi:hypothetical protein